ncbi:XdhC/CoxF family protein [Pelagibius litoralis]|uniref:XdhC/CoxF family protein n=1 Tax=Pelagibius litoralis TaxID=374515 RepID=A0A967C5W2_9PROT|nr:XdhC family protein [Pelagibius litoralis]NIA67107.1 XdhC/CoxF family protein [Pelagibius litoralis]
MKRPLLEALQAARAAKHPTALVTDLNDGRQTLIATQVAGGEPQGDLPLTAMQRTAVEAAVLADRSGPLGEDANLFVHVYNPPLRLVVVGAVHISQALVPMAQLAGYEVLVVDPRKAWANSERFPAVELVDGWPDEALRGLAPDHRTAVVVLTHDPKLDDPALGVALRSPVFYIGALGSRKTHAGRLNRLRDDGLDDSALARIHGPIGLAIGARSPAEIAIAILAQMTQVLHGATPLVKETPLGSDAAAAQ